MHQCIALGVSHVDILMDKKVIFCAQFVDYTKLTLLDLDMLNTRLFEKTVLYVLNELTVVYNL